MTTAAIVPLRASGADPLAGLLATKQNLLDQLAGKERALTRLAEAEAGVRSASAAIEALNMKEVEAVRGWATEGCKGDQPKPDHAERDRLGRALADATRAAAAAQPVRASLAEEIAEMRGRVVELDGQIRTGRIESFASDFAKALEVYRGQVDAVRQSRMDLLAIPAALAEFGRDKHFDLGDTPTARQFYSLAERLRSSAIPEVDPTEAEFRAAIDRWKGNIAGRIGK